MEDRQEAEEEDKRAKPLLPSTPQYTWPPVLNGRRIEWSIRVFFLFDRYRKNSFNFPVAIKVLIIELHQLIKYREGQRGTETERKHTPLDWTAGPEIRVMMMITDNVVILNGEDTGSESYPGRYIGPI